MNGRAGSVKFGRIWPSHPGQQTKRAVRARADIGQAERPRKSNDRSTGKPVGKGEEFRPTEGSKNDDRKLQPFADAGLEPEAGLVPDVAPVESHHSAPIDHGSPRFRKGLAAPRRPALDL